MSLKCSCKFQVDFGCILNDTEVMQVVKVTNHSPMDVKYQWSFIDSAIQFENKDEDEGLFTSIGRLKLGPCCVELYYGTVLGQKLSTQSPVHLCDSQ